MPGARGGGNKELLFSDEKVLEIYCTALCQNNHVKDYYKQIEKGKL